jgi:DNA polymerase-3 subunit epsilon
MSKKTLFIDTETTGTDPKMHGMIQLACIIDIDGKIEAEQSWNIKPFVKDAIDFEALKVNGLSLDTIQGYPVPAGVFHDFQYLLGAHCDKYNRNDKYYPAGFKVDFDLAFLREFFLKMNDCYIGSWFNGKEIDPLSLLRWLDWKGEISLPNYRLTTVCEYFGIKLDKAHDALADIRATRELINLLKTNFKLEIPAIAPSIEPIFQAEVGDQFDKYPNLICEISVVEGYWDSVKDWISHGN